MGLTIDVKVKDISPMTVAFINMKGNFSQIPATFQKLYGWIVQRGYKPVGPSIAVYYNIPGEVPDEELSWELRSRLSGDIAEAAPDTGGLGVKKLAAVKMATTVYKGPYENIEPVYIALNTWVSTSDYELDGFVEELYFNDPTIAGEEPVTEIRFPVRKR
jgi:effector-binding domain-containing protein